MSLGCSNHGIQKKSLKKLKAGEIFNLYFKEKIRIRSFNIIEKKNQSTKKLSQNCLQPWNMHSFSQENSLINRRQQP